MSSPGYAVHRVGSHDGPRAVESIESRSHGESAVTIIGVIAVSIGIWSAIVPFVGPIFGYSLADTAVWHWDLARGVLAVLPGCVGIVAGLLMLSGARAIELGIGRGSLQVASLLAFFSGGWFVLGPAVWSLLYGRQYLPRVTSPLAFAEVAGSALGPGVLLIAFAGVTMGCLARGSMIPTGPGDSAVVVEAQSIRDAEPLNTTAA